MLRSVVLVVHIVAGTAGLLLGPSVLRAALGDRRATGAAHAYVVAVTTLTVSAAVLVAFRPGDLWPFLLLAAGTLAAVLGARRAVAVDRHVRLVGGSYISLVTALLVVGWGSLAAWVTPTVVGTLLVERATSRLRPARTPSRTPTPSSPR